MHNTANLYWPEVQLNSSLLSPQSLSPSQTNDFKIHRPLRHWNSLVTSQRGVDEPSEIKQNLTLTDNQKEGLDNARTEIWPCFNDQCNIRNICRIHNYYSCTRMKIITIYFCWPKSQLSSSLLSPQSLSPSQTNDLAIHRPLRHRNSIFSSQPFIIIIVVTTTTTTTIINDNNNNNMLVYRQADKTQLKHKKLIQVK